MFLPAGYRIVERKEHKDGWVAIAYAPHPNGVYALLALTETGYVVLKRSDDPSRIQRIYAEFA